MKLVFEADSLSDLRLQVIHAAKELANETEVEEACVPETTGSVDQDQAIVPTGTPSREDLAPKRKRRTKAEMAAATRADDLADGPANSRPVTQPVDVQGPDFQGGFLATPQSMHKPVEVDEKPRKVADVLAEEIIKDEAKLKNFKENFTQTIFLLLQNKVIDQDYISARMKEYNLTNLMNMKNSEDKLEHFYDKLVREGKL